MAFDFIIPEQNFEKIRDKVASIITDEFAEQYILTSNPLFQAGIWIERFIPFDRQELPAVKVYFVQSSYDTRTPAASKGELKIYIEVHTKAKDSDSERGDKKSTIDCQKLVGAIRYILEHPDYLRLGYPTPQKFISGTNISDINISEPINQQDGLHVIAGRLILNVRYLENNGDLSGLPGEQYTSQIKLNDTDKGYKLEKIV